MWDLSARYRWIRLAGSGRGQGLMLGLHVQLGEAPGTQLGSALADLSAGQLGPTVSQRN